jgi:predicted dienelactone hydrolase
VGVIWLAPLPVAAAPAQGSLRVNKTGSVVRLTWEAGKAPYAIYRSPFREDVLRPAWLVASTQQLFYEEPVSDGGTEDRFFLVDDLLPCTTIADCDDRRACNGAETCDTHGRLCAKGRLVVCDDGNNCTSDACDEQTGGCRYTDLVCNDGNACTLDRCRADMGCYAAVDPGAGIGTPVELAGRGLAEFPFFDFVDVFNRGDAVAIGIDPVANPSVVGRMCDVYVLNARGATGWCAGTQLVDVRGLPDTFTFSAGGIRQNTFALTGSPALSADAGTGIGVGYDVVLDCDRDGFLDSGELVDGLEDDAGFYLVHDITQPGPLAVSQFDDLGPEPPHCSGGGNDDMRVYYPSEMNDSGFTGVFPLVVISHGNGHCYNWYDFLGRHLASYGYIAMAHDNDTGPGIGTASTTTLEFTDKILVQQATLGGGVLDGHIDSHRIAWIGHSRGGEGVVRAYDRLVDEGYAPQRYTSKDIVVISSIAPTDFLGPVRSNPHQVPYHLLYGSADGDVCGCPDNPVAQSFGVFERATGVRQSTYVHGADHNDFNCCGFEDFTGPADTMIGREEAQKVQKAVQLALLERYVEKSRAAKDFLSRPWEAFRPIGVSGTTRVVDELREYPGLRSFVIDDYQTQPDTGTSSSGGGVTASVAALAEGRETEADGLFEWTGNEPMNGMTRGRDVDTGRGGVFEFTAGGEAFYDLAVAPDRRDFSDDTYLSFRAAQMTRHPLTTAVLEDVTFTVTLVDGGGRRSSIDFGAYGGGIEEPYPRDGYGAGVGWQNEFQTIRIRLADFERDGAGLDLRDVRAVRFEFGGPFGSAEGRIGLDDVELVKE